MDNIRAGGYTLYNNTDITTTEKYLQQSQKTALRFNQMRHRSRIRETWTYLYITNNQRLDISLPFI